MKKKKYIPRFSSLGRAWQRGAYAGRKADSAYWRARFAKTKVSLINDLVENIERLVVVASFKAPPLRPALIDRFLILAHREHLAATLVFTKLDLVTAAQAAEQVTLYRQLGYPVYPLSQFSPTAHKIYEALRREVFKDSNNALVGHSGVGKTTLLNKIAPSYQGLTRTVSSASGKGRHTTNRVHCYEFDFGGAVYDLPGLREFTILGLELENVKNYYFEFAPFAAHCRYKNCLHWRETHCEVKRAVEEKTLPSLRYHSYLQILNALFKERQAHRF